MTGQVPGSGRHFEEALAMGSYLQSCLTVACHNMLIKNSTVEGLVIEPHLYTRCDIGCNT